jgi:putative PIN family toxin of toxin-antitoxin system
MTEGLRWVVDTDVLVSRLLAPRSLPARAVDKALASGILLVSEASLQELADVLARPKFDPYVSHDDRAQFIRLLGGVSRLLPIARRIEACRDPRDDKFLEVAIAGEAHAIITGDKDLLALHPFHGIDIVSPADFVARRSDD